MSPLTEMSHLIYSCVLQCAVLIFHSLFHPIYKHLSTLAFPLYCVWLFCSFVESLFFQLFRLLFSYYSQLSWKLKIFRNNFFYSLKIQQHSMEIFPLSSPILKLMLTEKLLRLKRKRDRLSIYCTVLVKIFLY